MFELKIQSSPSLLRNKKKRFFDRNTRTSLHFNKLQFLGEMYFTLRMKKEKEKKKGERKKTSRKRKSARVKNTGSKLVFETRPRPRSAPRASENKGGGEGVEEEEATLRGAPVNTFSDVVICRWFRPAGGQPFFHAFLRLPDLNPLKRLEQLFRVISSKGVGEVKLSRGG